MVKGYCSLHLATSCNKYFVSYFRVKWWSLNSISQLVTSHKINACSVFAPQHISALSHVSMAPRLCDQLNAKNTCNVTTTVLVKCRIVPLLTLISSIDYVCILAIVINNCHHIIEEIVQLEKNKIRNCLDIQETLSTHLVIWKQCTYNSYDKQNFEPKLVLGSISLLYQWFEVDIPCCYNTLPTTGPSTILGPYYYVLSIVSFKGTWPDNFGK